MSKIHAACLFATVVALSGCSDGPTITGSAPADPALSMGARQAATGGRATGHADVVVPILARTDRFSFTALSTGAGARGQFEGRYDWDAGGGARIHGSVDCLRLVGNRAFISGPIEEYEVNGLPVDPDGRHFFVWVLDNGEGAKAPSDLASFLVDFAGPQICNAGQELPSWPIDRGNIKVSQR